ncbi:hypothetical protein [Streptacidiphilus jiangxiensis]|uniref:Uncharacterized protein n=1 Tax=Streptacidiphilus jiangxiensis TaxID=235985 RepID=A0A1H7UW49_STRJI|nr:hypothetical protein [Streptacidiphilus jiangxiensis]SEM01192.1 hypothetical protein SAMN05414137_116211 [Streptacidiphilus jiangxiensis]
MNERAGVTRSHPRRTVSTGAGQVPTRRLSRALNTALRTGPFETALQLAITESGLSLDSLRRRLAADGVPVGISTLSYWQRGLRRPERPDSLRAVGAIEQLCGLPPSALVALLGPRRPRGRFARPRRGGGAALDFDQVIGADLLAAMRLCDTDVTVNSRYEHVSVHGDRWLRADRSWSVEQIRRIVIPLEPGLDRFVAISLPDAAGEGPPTVHPLHGCRLGRVRTDAGTGLQVAELLFDTPLRPGQPYAFDYEYRAGEGTQGAVGYHYGTRQPLRELVLRVHFDVTGLPVRCYRVERDHYDDEPGDLQELRPGRGGVVQLVSLDREAGFEGFRWEWD